MSRFVDTGASASGLGDYSRGAAVFFGYNAGNYTWTVPAGVTEVFVNVFGSGGRGGQPQSNNMGSGGGGGGYAGAALAVSTGQTYKITCGKGGWLAGGTTTVDGTDTTFSTSASSAILTASGGKGGTNKDTTSVIDCLGGLGGTGTVNQAALLISSFTASGGRGGNVSRDSLGTTYNLSTGGGASGSLSGDGGRGGGIFLSTNTSQSYNGTGGGGWGGGDGGDILTGTGSNSTSYYNTGGGGYLNSGGSIFAHQAGADFTSSGGTPFQGGQAWEASIYNQFYGQSYVNTGGTGVDQQNNAVSGRRSWWSYMTGEALTGNSSFLQWTTNGDGVGGWGGYPGTQPFTQQRAMMVPGFGGGLGGVAYYTSEQSQSQAWSQTGRGRRVGGGGGANHFMSPNMATSLSNAISKGGDSSAQVAALGRVSYGGGAGACRSTNAFGAGDGFVVICYK